MLTMTISKDLFHLFVCLFVCFDSLRPSQQFFSHVGTGLPGLNQYLAAAEGPCLRTQHSDSTGGAVSFVIQRDIGTREIILERKIVKIFLTISLNVCLGYS